MKGQDRVQGAARLLIGPLPRQRALQNVVIGASPNIDGRARVGREGLGEIGVERLRLVEERQRLQQPGALAGARHLLGAQIVVIGLEIGGRRARHPLGFHGRRLQAKRFGDLPAHLVLDGKHVRHAAIEPIGPQMVAGCRCR